MFILYAVALGLVAGRLLGGGLAGLGTVPLRWGWVALAGLAAQVVLFAEPVATRIGDLGTPLYLGSTVVVLAALLRNVRVPGLVLMAAGAAMNLAAILANGGCMPVDPAAEATLGRAAAEGYSNSCPVAAPALAQLTDVLAMPGWLPFANVISAGDLVLGAGVALAIVAGMRRRPDALGAPAH